MGIQVVSIWRVYWFGIVVQSFSHVWLFMTPWTAACQASLSFAISRSLVKNSCPLTQWFHPTISSTVISFFSCLQFFPASGSFPLSQLFASGSQSIGASASVLSMNIQGWFPLGLTGLISLLSKRPSRVLFCPQFENINSSVLSPLYGPALTSTINYWENHSLDYMYLYKGKGKLVFLLFNLLPRFVIVFLPRSKCLLITWLQSPSAEILESKKTKSLTVPFVSPSVCHEVRGSDAMVLVFWMFSLLIPGK